jgi:hypothetical protein
MNRVMNASMAGGRNDNAGGGADLNGAWGESGSGIDHFRHVRFYPHNSLMSDIAALPKCARRRQAVTWPFASRTARQQRRSPLQ